MFQWSSVFETGIAEIDQQHQELFRIGESLCTKLTAPAGPAFSDELMDHLEDLAMYASYHFDTEESLFEKYGYYDCEAHRAEHRAFSAHLETFDIDRMDREPQDALQELLNFVAQWIFRHISQADFKYATVIREQMDKTA